jgi:hypothetical protein
MVAVVTAVAACNQVLDLDQPDRIPTLVDGDGDGIADSRDNCPQLANSEQLDSDHDRRGDACDSCPLAPPTRDRDSDGLDDACDPCVLGPQIDDDGDGVMDACDLCPVTVTAQQVDSDGDLIGDECDAPARSVDHKRQLFDGFTSLGPSWEGGAAWIGGGDGSSITPAGSEDAQLRYIMASERGASAVSVMVDVPADGQVLLSFADPAQSCVVSCAGGMCSLRLQDGQGEQVGPFPFHRGTIHMTYRPQAFQIGGWSCSLYEDGLAIAVAGIELSGAGPSSLVMRASPGTKVFGVDLVD